MQGFPTITQNNITGEIGVNAVSRIVNNELKWIFRRNHGEHDFGIDGYIDVVNDEGGVTGQTFAVQIKTGESFFREKESKGFVFHGKKKHLNYYANLSHPILIILCDPVNEFCYWALFDINKIDNGKSGWKLVVDKTQILSKNTRQRLLDIVGPAINVLDDIEANWALNRQIKEADCIHYVISRDDIENGNSGFLTDFFERLQLNDDLCLATQGKVELFIDGYNSDQRELWQIPEVISWIKQVEPQIKYWFYFIRTQKPCHWLQTFALCLWGAFWLKQPKPYVVGKAGEVSFDKNLFVEFMERNFCWLNEITENLGLSEDENRRITAEVAQALRLPRPK